MNKLQKKIEQLIISQHALKKSRNPRKWIFGEWYGTRANDNACFLANYISEKYKEKNNLDLVWLADNSADLHLLNRKIRVVNRNSEEARKLLYEAGVSIVNQGIVDLTPDDLNYAKGSISINLWHGIPWKHVFLDQFSNVADNKLFKKQREKLASDLTAADYWLAPSDDMRNILIRANFVKPENIIKTGYPRNSYFYNEDELSHLRNTLINKIGANEDSKIIAYMPTFRDQGDDVFSFNSLADDKEFYSWLEDNDVYIIQKAHFVNEEKHHLTGIQADKINNRIINDNDIAAFELMGASDILVTDYSSCFFDYLILDRPIVHFIYDYDKYVKQDRGVYYTADEVCCGDAVRTVNELKSALAANIADPNKNKELRKRRREEFINFENDHSCEDIYQFIITRVKEKFNVDLND